MKPSGPKDSSSRDDLAEDLVDSTVLQDENILSPSNPHTPNDGMNIKNIKAIIQEKQELIWQLNSQKVELECASNFQLDKDKSIEYEQQIKDLEQQISDLEAEISQLESRQKELMSSTVETEENVDNIDKKEALLSQRNEMSAKRKNSRAKFYQHLRELEVFPPSTKEERKEIKDNKAIVENEINLYRQKLEEIDMEVNGIESRENNESELNRRPKPKNNIGRLSLRLEKDYRSRRETELSFKNRKRSVSAPQVPKNRDITGQVIVKQKKPKEVTPGFNVIQKNDDVGFSAHRKIPFNNRLLKGDQFREFQAEYLSAPGHNHQGKMEEKFTALLTDLSKSYDKRFANEPGLSKSRNFQDKLDHIWPITDHIERGLLTQAYKNQQAGVQDEALLNHLEMVQEFNKNVRSLEMIAKYQGLANKEELERRQQNVEKFFTEENRKKFKAAFLAMQKGGEYKVDKKTQQYAKFVTKASKKFGPLGILGKPVEKHLPYEVDFNEGSKHTTFGNKKLQVTLTGGKDKNTVTGKFSYDREALVGSKSFKGKMFDKARRKTAKKAAEKLKGQVDAFMTIAINDANKGTPQNPFNIQATQPEIGFMMAMNLKERAIKEGRSFYAKDQNGKLFEITSDPKLNPQEMAYMKHWGSQNMGKNNVAYTMLKHTELTKKYDKQDFIGQSEKYHDPRLSEGTHDPILEEILQAEVDRRQGGFEHDKTRKQQAKRTEKRAKAFKKAMSAQNKAPKNSSRRKMS